MVVRVVQRGLCWRRQALLVVFDRPAVNEDDPLGLTETDCDCRICVLEHASEGDALLSAPLPVPNLAVENYLVLDAAHRHVKKGVTVLADDADARVIDGRGAVERREADGVRVEYDAAALADRVAELGALSDPERLGRLRRRPGVHISGRGADERGGVEDGARAAGEADALDGPVDAQRELVDLFVVDRDDPLLVDDAGGDDGAVPREDSGELDTLFVAPVAPRLSAVEDDCVLGATERYVKNDVLLSVWLSVFLFAEKVERLHVLRLIVTGGDVDLVASGSTPSRQRRAGCGIRRDLLQR